MTRYRFNGRIAKFFRETGNGWASRVQLAEGVNASSKSVGSQIKVLHDSGNLERRTGSEDWNLAPLRCATLSKTAPCPFGSRNAVLFQI